jgi:hypothetical protein
MSGPKRRSFDVAHLRRVNLLIRAKWLCEQSYLFDCSKIQNFFLKNVLRNDIIT